MLEGLRSTVETELDDQSAMFEAAYNGVAGFINRLRQAADDFRFGNKGNFSELGQSSRGRSDRDVRVAT